MEKKIRGFFFQKKVKRGNSIVGGAGTLNEK
jgi:hypothetical protein